MDSKNLISELTVSVRCYYSVKDTFSDDADILKALFTSIDSSVEMPLPVYTHLYAMTLEFKPDLIIELGRARGNSTCVFTQAAQRLDKTVVKSFCYGPGWERHNKIAQVVNHKWFERLEIYSGDITRVDFSEHVLSAQRVLVFWDAHGFSVANHVLGHIMPLLQDKQHIILCHDMSDNRVVNIGKDYGEKSFWRGMNDYYKNKNKRARQNLFWINTVVDQAIPIVDFCWRNGIELHSPDFELHEINKHYPHIIKDIMSFIPLESFSECNHWMYFSLNESEGPYHFPLLANTSFSLIKFVMNNRVLYSLFKKCKRLFRIFSA